MAHVTLFKILTHVEFMCIIYEVAILYVSNKMQRKKNQMYENISYDMLSILSSRQKVY